MGTNTSSGFEELLASLEAAHQDHDVLAKALGKGDPEDEDEDDDNDGDGDCLTKSLTVGEEEYNVVDAEALIKSIADLGIRASTTEQALAKGLNSMLSLINQQSQLFKSLDAKITALAGQGAGRKTVVSIHQKGDEALAKSLAGGDQLSAEGFMAKSLEAYTGGKISGKEYSTIDVAKRGGQLPLLDKGLIARVLA